MKKFKTSIIAFTLLLLASLVLVACGDKADKDQVAVDAAKETLVLGLQAPDTLENVTQDITLPATAGEGVTVVWASSNTAVISVAGKVERQAENTNVKLTATLSKGDATANKEFNVVVAKADTAAVDAAVAALIAHYADTLGNAEWKATANVTLVSTLEGHDVAITWAVIQGGSNFTTAGVVTRPTFTEGDVTVQLRATIGSRTHNFYFLIEKLEETVEEKINKALNLVTIVPATPSGYQETNFAAVATTKIDGVDVTVTWTSSDLTAMTNAGVLVSFDDVEEKEVTLTASITYDGVTLTKDVVFLVKGVTTYDSLLGALVDANKNEKVKVNGVAHFDDLSGGYYIASADNLIVYVHGSKPASLKAGKLYDVIFTVDIYHGSFQAKDVSFSNERDGELPVITPIEMTLEEVVNLPKPTEVSFNHTLITLVDVKVRVDDPADNYKTFFVPQDLADDAVLTDKNSIMVYYQSKIDIIKGLDGAKINSINLINNGYRTNNIVWYVNFTQTLGDIDLSLTDAEVVDSVETSLKAKVSNLYYAATDLQLPTEQLEANIVWTSSHPDIISTAGVVVMPANPTEVTLTAVITKGAATKTLTKVVLVGTGAGITTSVEDFLDGNVGDRFQLTAVVTGIGSNRAYTFEDATGATIAYVSANIILDIGYEYTIIGTKALYNGMIQLSQISGVAAVKGDAKALPAAVEVTEAMLAEGIIGLQGHLINIDQAVVTNVAIDSYGNITLTLKVGDQTITLKWDSRMVLPAEVQAHLQEGVVKDAVVSLVAIPLAWNNGPVIGYNAISQIQLAALSDADKVAMDKAELDLVEVYTFAYQLPVAGTQGSTITWVADPAGSLAEGKLVVPAEGEVVVTLTATITNGAATDTKEFIVTVKVPGEAELKYDLLFEDLTENTSYLTTETTHTMTNKVVGGADLDVVRINSNISIQASSGKGIVLAMRGSTNFASTYLRTGAKIDGLQKVEFVVSNWTNDANYNMDDFVEAIYVQTSTDGTTWVNQSADLKATWNKAASANNTLTVEFTELTEAVYVRLFVEAKSGITSEYQLRLIVLSMKVWA